MIPTTQSSIGVKYINVNPIEQKYQQPAPSVGKVVLVPNQMLQSSEIRTAQVVMNGMIQPAFMYTPASQPQTKAKDQPRKPPMRTQTQVPQMTQQQMMQYQQQMYAFQMQQQQLYFQQMQAIALQGNIPVSLPPAIPYNPHQQIYHQQVTPQGYGVTFTSGPSQPPQQQEQKKQTQPSAKSPEESKPTTPGSTLRKQASPFSPKAAPKPTAVPQSTPPIAKRPASTRYVPPSKRDPGKASTEQQSPEGTPELPQSEQAKKALPQSERPKYTIEWLLQVREQYTKSPPDLVRSLKGRNKFDFNFLLPVEDLEKSDESWRQQVEELKQSNPLVTAARRMLNKVTNDTLELFTKKLVEVLQEAQQEGREVMTAAVESFTDFLFKKASVDNNHRKLYAKLLCGMGDKFWQGGNDALSQLFQECIQDECDRLFLDISPERKFKLRGSSEWLAILFSKNVIDQGRFFRVIRPIVFGIEDEDVDPVVRNLSLDIATNALLNNMKAFKGKKNEFRKRFQEYIEFLMDIKPTFKNREQFAIQDLVEAYSNVIPLADE